MKPRTYAEATGHAPFDWAEFLNRESETITEDEWIHAQRRAQSWPTCACGNLCDAIPRWMGSEDELGGSHGEPKDRNLSNLGYGFFSAVFDHDIPSACSIFAQIEARSTEILKEMGKL
jgi:hypothetical protein